MYIFHQSHINQIQVQGFPQLEFDFRIKGTKRGGKKEEGKKMCPFIYLVFCMPVFKSCQYCIQAAKPLIEIYLHLQAAKHG